MKRSTIAFFLLALLAASTYAQANKPIFREIDVSTADKKRSIALGGDLKDNTDILIKSGDLFVLNGNFGNTERLALRLTKEGKVSQMIFDYRGDKNFDTTVASYTKTLGKPPVSQSLSTALISIRMVAWDDGRTRFEILEKTVNDQISVSSVLIDKKPHKISSALQVS